MRFLITSIGLLLTSGIACGQNLVPNGGFEEYTDCPDFLNQMYRATGWSRYRGSPDYFNRCDTTDSIGISSEQMGVPSNAFGWQEPATGDAYAGGYLWSYHPSGAEMREHWGTMLTEPLQPWTPVYISFKISPTTGGILENMHWTVAGAGLRFTMTPYLQDTGWEPLPNYAAAFMSVPPTDTSMWYQVSGVYVPDSAYQFVVLGNFFADTLLTLVDINPNGTFQAVYVYYDDVCVSYSAGDCGVDTGVSEPWGEKGMRAYPNPFTDGCKVLFDESHSETLHLELVDLSGRPVWHGKLLSGQHSMEVLSPHLEDGVFYLRAISTKGAFPPIVLIHVSL